VTEGVHVVVSDGRGHDLHMRSLSSWLRRVAPRGANGVVSVALLSDERVRVLNRMYRRRDYATDVLSFPVESLTPRASRAGRSSRRKTKAALPPPNPESRIPSPEFLGDIVIARGVARRQAREAGHSELAELRSLVLHGLLHLLGYDHERDDGEMERLESRLRRKGGLRV
jgi:probable rRNA maturation factor